MIGRTLEIEMKFTSDSTCSTVWIHNNSEKVDEEYYCTECISESVFLSKLYIKNCHSKNAGMYLLNVSNEFGHDEAECAVFIVADNQQFGTMNISEVDVIDEDALGDEHVETTELDELSRFTEIHSAKVFPIEASGLECGVVNKTDQVLDTFTFEDRSKFTTAELSERSASDILLCLSNANDTNNTPSPVRENQIFTEGFASHSERLWTNLKEVSNFEQAFISNSQSSSESKGAHIAIEQAAKVEEICENSQLTRCLMGNHPVTKQINDEACQPIVCSDCSINDIVKVANVSLSLDAFVSANKELLTAASRTQSIAEWKKSEKIQTQTFEEIATLSEVIKDAIVKALIIVGLAEVKDVKDMHDAQWMRLRDSIQPFLGTYAKEVENFVRITEFQKTYVDTVRIAQAKEGSILWSRLRSNLQSALFTTADILNERSLLNEYNNVEMIVEGLIAYGLQVWARPRLGEGLYGLMQTYETESDPSLYENLAFVSGVGQQDISSEVPTSYSTLLQSMVSVNVISEKCTSNHLMESVIYQPPKDEAPISSSIIAEQFSTAGELSSETASTLTDSHLNVKSKIVSETTESALNQGYTLLHNVLGVSKEEIRKWARLRESLDAQLIFTKCAEVQFYIEEIEQEVIEIGQSYLSMESMQSVVNVFNVCASLEETVTANQMADDIIHASQIIADCHDAIVLDFIKANYNVSRRLIEGIALDSDKLWRRLRYTLDAALIHAKTDMYSELIENIDITVKDKLVRCINAAVDHGIIWTRIRDTISALSKLKPQVHRLTEVIHEIPLITGNHPARDHANISLWARPRECLHLEDYDKATPIIEKMIISEGEIKQFLEKGHSLEEFNTWQRLRESIKGDKIEFPHCSITDLGITIANVETLASPIEKSILAIIADQNILPSKKESAESNVFKKNMFNDSASILALVNLAISKLIEEEKAEENEAKETRDKCSFEKTVKLGKGKPIIVNSLASSLLTDDLAHEKIIEMECVNDDATIKCLNEQIDDALEMIGQDDCYQPDVEECEDLDEDLIMDELHEDVELAISNKEEEPTNKDSEELSVIEKKDKEKDTVEPTIEETQEEVDFEECKKEEMPKNEEKDDFQTIDTEKTSVHEDDNVEEPEEALIEEMQEEVELNKSKEEESQKEEENEEFQTIDDTNAPKPDSDEAEIPEVVMDEVQHEVELNTAKKEDTPKNKDEDEFQTLEKTDETEKNVSENSSVHEDDVDAPEEAVMDEVQEEVELNTVKKEDVPKNTDEDEVQTLDATDEAEEVASEISSVHEEDINVPEDAVLEEAQEEIELSNMKNEDIPENEEKEEFQTLEKICNQEEDSELPEEAIMDENQEEVELENTKTEDVPNVDQDENFEVIETCEDKNDEESEIDEHSIPPCDEEDGPMHEAADDTKIDEQVDEVIDQESLKSDEECLEEEIEKIEEQLPEKMPTKSLPDVKQDIIIRDPAEFADIKLNLEKCDSIEELNADLDNANSDTVSANENLNLPETFEENVEKCMETEEHEDADEQQISISKGRGKQCGIIAGFTSKLEAKPCPNQIPVSEEKLYEDGMIATEDISNMAIHSLIDNRETVKYDEEILAAEFDINEMEENKKLSNTYKIESTDSYSKSFEQEKVYFGNSVTVDDFIDEVMYTVSFKTEVNFSEKVNVSIDLFSSPKRKTSIAESNIVLNIFDKLDKLPPPSSPVIKPLTKSETNIKLNIADITDLQEEYMISETNILLNIADNEEFANAIVTVEELFEIHKEDISVIVDIEEETSENTTLTKVHVHEHPIIEYNPDQHLDEIYINVKEEQYDMFKETATEQSQEYLVNVNEEPSQVTMETSILKIDVESEFTQKTIEEEDLKYIVSVEEDTPVVKPVSITTTEIITEVNLIDETTDSVYVVTVEPCDQSSPHYPPVFITESPPQICAVENTDLTISVELFAPDRTSYVILLDDYPIDNYPRFYVNQEQIGSNFLLNINLINAQKPDSGKLRILAKNDHGADIWETNLNILRPIYENKPSNYSFSYEAPSDISSTYHPQFSCPSGSKTQSPSYYQSYNGNPRQISQRVLYIDAPSTFNSLTFEKQSSLSDLASEIAGLCLSDVMYSGNRPDHFFTPSDCDSLSEGFCSPHPLCNAFEDALLVDWKDLNLLSSCRKPKSFLTGKQNLSNINFSAYVSQEESLQGKMAVDLLGNVVNASVKAPRFNIKTTKKRKGCAHIHWPKNNETCIRDNLPVDVKPVFSKVEKYIEPVVSYYSEVVKDVDNKIMSSISVNKINIEERPSCTMSVNSIQTFSKASKFHEMKLNNSMLQHVSKGINNFAAIENENIAVYFVDDKALFQSKTDQCNLSQQKDLPKQTVLVEENFFKEHLYSMPSSETLITIPIESAILDKISTVNKKTISLANYKSLSSDMKEIAANYVKKREIFNCVYNIQDTPIQSNTEYSNAVSEITDKLKHAGVKTSCIDSCKIEDANMFMHTVLTKAFISTAIDHVFDNSLVNFAFEEGYTVSMTHTNFKEVIYELMKSVPICVCTMKHLCFENLSEMTNVRRTEIFATICSSLINYVESVVLECPTALRSIAKASLNEVKVLTKPDVASKPEILQDESSKPETLKVLNVSDVVVYNSEQLSEEQSIKFENSDSENLNVASSNHMKHSIEKVDICTAVEDTFESACKSFDVCNSIIKCIHEPSIPNKSEICVPVSDDSSFEYSESSLINASVIPTENKNINQASSKVEEIMVSSNEEPVLFGKAHCFQSKAELIAMSSVFNVHVQKAVCTDECSSTFENATQSTITSDKIDEEFFDVLDYDGAANHQQSASIVSEYIDIENVTNMEEFIDIHCDEMINADFVDSESPIYHFSECIERNRCLVEDVVLETVVDSEIQNYSNANSVLLSCNTCSRLVQIRFVDNVYVCESCNSVIVPEKIYESADSQNITANIINSLTQLQNSLYNQTHDAVSESIDNVIFETVEMQSLNSQRASIQKQNTGKTVSVPEKIDSPAEENMATTVSDTSFEVAELEILTSEAAKYCYVLNSVSEIVELDAVSQLENINSISANVENIDSLMMWENVDININGNCFTEKADVQEICFDEFVSHFSEFNVETNEFAEYQYINSFTSKQLCICDSVVSCTGQLTEKEAADAQSLSKCNCEHELQCEEYLIAEFDHCKIVDLPICEKAEFTFVEEEIDYEDVPETLCKTKVPEDAEIDEELIVPIECIDAEGGLQRPKFEYPEDALSFNSPLKSADLSDSDINEEEITPVDIDELDLLINPFVGKKMNAETYLFKSSLCEELAHAEFETSLLFNMQANKCNIDENLIVADEVEVVTEMLDLEKNDKEEIISAESDSDGSFKDDVSFRTLEKENMVVEDIRSDLLAMVSTVRDLADYTVDCKEWNISFQQDRLLAEHIPSMLTFSTPVENILFAIGKSGICEFEQLPICYTNPKKYYVSTKIFADTPRRSCSDEIVITSCFDVEIAPEEVIKKIKKKSPVIYVVEEIIETKRVKKPKVKRNTKAYCDAPISSISDYFEPLPIPSCSDVPTVVSSLSSLACEDTYFTASEMNSENQRLSVNTITSSIFDKTSSYYSVCETLTHSTATLASSDQEEHENSLGGSTPDLSKSASQHDLTTPSMDSAYDDIYKRFSDPIVLHGNSLPEQTVECFNFTAERANVVPCLENSDLDFIEKSRKSTKSLNTTLFLVEESSIEERVCAQTKSIREDSALYPTYSKQKKLQYAHIYPASCEDLETPCARAIPVMISPKYNSNDNLEITTYSSEEELLSLSDSSTISSCSSKESILTTITNSSQSSDMSFIDSVSSRSSSQSDISFGNIRSKIFESETDIRKTFNEADFQNKIKVNELKKSTFGMGKHVKMTLTLKSMHESKTNKQVSTDRSKVLDNVTATYVVPPRIIRSVDDKLFNEGSPIVMTIHALAEPKPTFTWIKDTKTLQPSAGVSIKDTDMGSTVMLFNAKDTDCGYYMCKVQNDCGMAWCSVKLSKYQKTVFSPFSRKASSTNQYKVKKVSCGSKKADETVSLQKSQSENSPKFTTPLKSQVLFYGQDVTLTVKYNGFPEPRVSFYKDGDLVKTGVTINKKSASLTLENVRKSDAGMYTCRLVNQNGKASSSNQITVANPKKPLKEREDRSHSKMVRNATNLVRKAFSSAGFAQKSFSLSRDVDTSVYEISPEKAKKSVNFKF
uniref:Titin-like protein n=1 Tax=Hofstenia miamia TaxID=442651 RepID=A0A2D3E4T7_HOFMI|nr:titin-like protein [Hofstenia miamia]